MIFCSFFRVLHLGKKEISLSFSFFATCIAHSSYAAGAQAHEYSSSQERIAMNGTFFMYGTIARLGKLGGYDLISE